MDENRISSVKALLYDTDNDEVKRTILQTEDQEILYNDYPIEGLKEVIIVYEGTVQSIYP